MTPFRILCAAVLLALAGCTRAPKVMPFDKSIVDGSGYTCVLAFDLRQDNRPTADLIVRIPTSENSIQSKTILLPFTSSRAGSDPEIYTTWGSRPNCCTLIGYHALPGVGGVYGVGISPEFDDPPKDLSELPGRLYFVPLASQERRFYYRYPDHSLEKQMTLLKASTDISEPDAIAIAIPSSAKRLFVDSNKPERPARIAETDKATFFPAHGQAGEFLEIRYPVPLNSMQQTILKGLGELLQQFPCLSVHCCSIRLSQTRGDLKS